MPYVQPGLLGTSIFLYGSEADATSGANWGGSGFLLGFPSKANPSRTHLYAVSNDHVIHSCPVIRLVKANGESYVLPGTDSEWHPHPDGDDIAIRSIGAVAGGEFGSLGIDLILSPAEIAEHSIGPGDECLMVGRYINHELQQFDRPVVRFGNLAMMPEGVYQAARSFEQESFLVDMRSQAGFSGSPVLLYFEESGWRNLPPYPEGVDYKLYETAEEINAAHAEWKEAMEQLVADRHVSGLMAKTWLLGIDWGHLPVWGDVYDDSKQKAGRMEVSTGMAGVVPAWKLLDLLCEKGVEMARDKAEEQLSAKDEGAAVLDTSEPDEFAQFEDLAQKLVQVPKRELDEKRKDES